MIKTNLNLVRSKMTELQRKQNTGSRDAVRDMANTLVQLSMEEIKGERGSHRGPEGGKIYDKAIAGHPPMNRTGNLRRSIHADYYTMGIGDYRAVVGPSMKYARAVELGHSYAPRSWSRSSAIQGFPYMSPAYDKFIQVMPTILAKHLGR